MKLEPADYVEQNIPSQQIFLSFRGRNWTLFVRDSLQEMPDLSSECVIYVLVKYYDRKSLVLNIQIRLNLLRFFCSTLGPLRTIALL